MNTRKAPRTLATKAKAYRKETTMTTIMNNNVSVNDLNGSKSPSNMLGELENGVYTVKCVTSTSSLDASGDYRVTRRLECKSMNALVGTPSTCLDLEIAGSKGTTPVVTINGQVIPGKSMSFDGSGNLEVRSGMGMLLDIVKLPFYEDATNQTGLQTPNTSPKSESKSRPIQETILGLVVGPVSGDLAHNMSIDAPNACTIGAVVPGSPAFEAGLEPNDVILGINGKPANLTNLCGDLNISKSGQPLKLLILCKGIKSEVTVTPGEGGWKAASAGFKPGVAYQIDSTGANYAQGYVAGNVQKWFGNTSGASFGYASPARNADPRLSAGTLI